MNAIIFSRNSKSWKINILQRILVLVHFLLVFDSLFWLWKPFTTSFSQNELENVCFCARLFEKFKSYCRIPARTAENFKLEKKAFIFVGAWIISTFWHFWPGWGQINRQNAYFLSDFGGKSNYLLEFGRFCVFWSFRLPCCLCEFMSFSVVNNFGWWGIIRPRPV